VFSNVDYSPAAGLAAYGDRDFGDPMPPCGRGVVLAATSGQAPPMIHGADIPVFGPGGAQLAYVDCNRTVQVRNLATGKEAAAFQPPNENDSVVRIAWVKDEALVVNLSDGSMLYVPLGGDASASPLPGSGTLVTGRGRFGTVAFWDGTHISSLNPANGNIVQLVQPAAAPTSLDADESGAHLLWADANADLWKWSGGDPVKVGSGFNSAAW
jgi:hypothetical protein